MSFLCGRKYFLMLRRHDCSEQAGLSGAVLTPAWLAAGPSGFSYPARALEAGRQVWVASV